MNKQPENAYADVCARVGHAMTKWSEVEHTLGLIFVFAIKSASRDVALEAFYSVVSFDAKLKMVNVGVNLALSADSELKSNWTTLFNRLSRKSKTRNKLAHGRVVGLIAAADAGGSAKGIWLVPYFGELRTERGASKIENLTDKLGTHDLDQIAQDFTKMNMELIAFLSGLGAELGVVGGRIVSREE